MDEFLEVEGRRLRLQSTRLGPLLHHDQPGSLESLAWVLNAYVTGAFAEVRDALVERRSVVIPGLSLAPFEECYVEPEVRPARDAFLRENPGASVDDLMVAGTTFVGEQTVIQRTMALAILDALVRERRAFVEQTTR